MGAYETKTLIQLVHIDWSLLTIDYRQHVKHYLLHFMQYFFSVEGAYIAESPRHRQSNSTLSLLRGTSISTQCLQSGHKTATTL